MEEGPSDWLKWRRRLLIGLFENVKKKNNTNETRDQNNFTSQCKYHKFPLKITEFGCSQIDAQIMFLNGAQSKLRLDWSAAPSEKHQFEKRSISESKKNEKYFFKNV